MNKLDIHPIQSTILCELLFVEDAAFKELNKNGLGSDLFSFHLRQLTDWKLITKNELGRYLLTTRGKEYANRFDSVAVEVERQPKLGVLIVGIKNIKGKNLFLGQQRLKQPYFGFWGFVTGKIKWGEKAFETAERELLEETGLSAKLTLVGLRHKTDYSKQGELLEDKYFLTFKAENMQGNLIENFEGGKNRWMTKGELLEQKDVFDDVEKVMEMVEKDSFGFEEVGYKVKRY
jgi:8-oxo-dGTP pyrophosphatase MutT (NUDIX family)